MGEKYIRKEIVTITLTEEVTVTNQQSEDELVILMWRLIKKYLSSFCKLIGGNKNG